MRELLARGKPVRMVDRHGSTSLPEEVERMSGDAADRRFARDASADARVVYQCLSPPYHRWPELFPGLQAGVVAGAAAAGAVLVALENVYMYGPPGQRALTEKSPMTAMTRKGRVRARMSEALMEAHSSGRARVVIARSSDFFGPDVRVAAMGARVFGAALVGRPASVVGNLDRMHTQTFMPDIARALVLLAESADAVGEVWHLPAPETVTTRRFLELVFEHAGHPLKIRRAGRAMVRLLGYFNPTVRELREMMYQFEESFFVDNSKFVATFGDVATPLSEAIGATVDWYQKSSE